jgi:hypothetical protein
MKTKTSSEVLKEYVNLSNAKKVSVLNDAIDYMQQYNGRTKFLCVAMAMGYEQDSNNDNNYIKTK